MRKRMAFTHQMAAERRRLIQRERAAGAGVRHARQRAETLFELLPVHGLPGPAFLRRKGQRELVEADVGAERQQMIGADARVDRLYLHQAAQHQPGRDQQHERRADLRDDEHSAKALARRTGAAAVAQRGRGVDPLRERRDRSEHEAGRDRDPKRERQHGEVD
jgi:hypothetical protein